MYMSDCEEVTRVIAICQLIRKSITPAGTACVMKNVRILHLHLHDLLSIRPCCIQHVFNTYVLMQWR